MTEEEKKERKRERSKLYYEKNKEKIREKHREYAKDYYQNNKEKIKLYDKERYKKNVDKLIDYSKSYYTEHKEQKIQYNKEYKKKKYNTISGRAYNRWHSYDSTDNKKGWQCTLTPEFIETEILTKSCIYCGESDWTKLGCDRIDNDLPHTPENVVCSCWACNDDRNKKKMSVEEYKEYKKRGSH